MAERSEPEEPRRRRASAWIMGALVLAGLVAVATHFTEGERFLLALRNLAPRWLLAAFGLQLATYLCAGGVWAASVRSGGARMRVGSLAGLGLVKLFVDQAVPSAGVGGTAAVVRALILLDATTVHVLLVAVGAPAHPSTSLAAFILASAAGTLSILPGGLGTFEAASVATLNVFGVPFESALVAQPAAWDAALEPVGATPTLSWDPPATGAAPHYEIVVSDTTDVGSRRRREFVRVYTERTSFTFPEGVLLEGRYYFARVRAVSEDRPLDEPTVLAGDRRAVADVFTGFFTP